MHIAQNWRINGQRYALKGARCEKCQKVSFPPREVCPYCAANHAAAYPLTHEVIEMPEVVVLQRAGTYPAMRLPDLHATL
jgi:uncharacterized OB-fold protein